MSELLTAEAIKATREKYGLSQRAFAALLGIGEASIVRYEQGTKPTKANANLIRAAGNPRFMAECLERDGNLLSPRQQAKAERYIYAMVELPANANETDEAAMTMNEIYDFTLRQEVLAERCANLIADIVRAQTKDRLAGGDGLENDNLLMALARLKPTIATREAMDWEKLDRIGGYLDCADEIIHPRRIQEAS